MPCQGALLPGREFGIGRAVGVRSQLVRFSVDLTSEGGGGVLIRLPEDDHPDIRVQVDPPRLPTDEPQMYQVAKVFVVVLVLVRRILLVRVHGLLLARRHVQRSLAQESLRIRRHVMEIVNDYEHLHHRSQRVEQGHLNRPGSRHVVPLLTQIYMALK